MTIDAIWADASPSRQLILSTDCVRAYVRRCTLSSGEREIHSQHRGARVAVLLRGRFRYRARADQVLLTRGAMLIGRPGEGYGKSAVGRAGDLCLVFEYPSFFIDRLEPTSRSPDAAAVSYIPVGPTTIAHASELERAFFVGDRELLLEASCRIAAAAFSNSGRARSDQQLTKSQAAQVLAVVEHLESSYAENCDLSALAKLVGLDSFRLLRLFKTLTGQTPRQFLLAQRLSAAATMLVRANARIIDVALESGFTDISHFNAMFRRAYGEPPARYRASRRRGPR